MTPDSGQPARAKSAVVSAVIATAIAFSILISLGIWQLHRLHWKQGLLAQIAQAEQAPPVPLAGAAPVLFERVEATGTWQTGPVALYGAEVRENHMGAQLVELLNRPGWPPLVTVLGWVPTDAGPVTTVSGAARVTGYVRLPESGNFLSAPDDVAGRHFYSLNPGAIAKALGVATAAPFTLMALGPSKPGIYPQPADTLPQPANNHLQYAFTWFGLAAALLGVLLSWLLKQRGG